MLEFFGWVSRLARIVRAHVLLLAVAMFMLCLLPASGCNRVALSKPTPSPKADIRTPEQRAFENAIVAEKHRDYAAASDPNFDSRRLLDDGADFIALGRYAQARGSLRRALALVLNGRYHFTAFPRSWERPSRADYVAEFKRRGGSVMATGENDNPCTGDTVSALDAAIGGLLKIAKQRLLVGLARPGCPNYQLDYYQSYLAAVLLSQGRRNEALSWLSRGLLFEIPEPSFTVLSQSALEAAFIFARASDRNLETVRTYIRKEYTKPWAPRTRPLSFAHFSRST